MRELSKCHRIPYTVYPDPRARRRRGGEGGSDDRRLPVAAPDRVHHRRARRRGAARPERGGEVVVSPRRSAAQRLESTQSSHIAALAWTLQLAEKRLLRHRLAPARERPNRRYGQG